jgi:hypothetical protein
LGLDSKRSRLFCLSFLLCVPQHSLANCRSLPSQRDRQCPLERAWGQAMHQGRLPEHHALGLCRRTRLGLAVDSDQRYVLVCACCIRSHVFAFRAVCLLLELASAATSLPLTYIRPCVRCRVALVGLEVALEEEALEAGRSLGREAVVVAVAVAQGLGMHHSGRGRASGRTTAQPTGQWSHEHVTNSTMMWLPPPPPTHTHTHTTALTLHSPVM